MVQIKGFDISRYQGQVDFKRAKASGLEFVMIKATQGVHYSSVDYFTGNAPKALEAGLDVGAYHYATFRTVEEAKAQVDYFLSVIKGQKLTYPVVCDIEENGGVGKEQLTDALITFLEGLENAGYFAMYYTFESFLNNSLDESRLKPYARWGAMALKGDMWQYNQHGRVEGVAGEVDLDYAYVDFAQLVKAVEKRDELKHEVKPAVKVEPSKEQVYVVKSGDCLDKIAGDLHVTEDHLVKLNHIEHPDLIYVGQKLIY